MRIAYLDCFSGISGDMFLGALVDAGVPIELLDKTIAALDIGARLEMSKVSRSGITATKVDVYAGGEKDLPREVYWERRDEAEKHSHPNDHSHGGEHEHDHEGHSSRAGAPAPHGHAHSHGQLSESARTGVSAPHVHGRGLKEIREIIRKAAISEGAKQAATAIFEALGTAEAKIHNTEIEEIHFHEVGAVDAMVDIVCAAVGAEALGVDEIVCSPLNVGGGLVKCAHGEFPVPAPATLELLKGAPIYSSGVEKELVTPTGAAIVKILAKRFSPFPEMKVEKIGYGAGSRDIPGHANVLRISIGEAASRISIEHLNVSAEIISVLEANLDDLSPQVFGYVMDRLLDEGALDVFGVPVQMKKNRPGAVLTVLCKPEDAAKLTKLIFAETTTLGVRQREEQRVALARRWVTVGTKWGDVRVKIASLNGTVTNYAPEYEDCRRIAVERHVPLKDVMQEAISKYLGKS